MLPEASPLGAVRALSAARLALRAAEPLVVLRLTAALQAAVPGVVLQAAVFAAAEPLAVPGERQAAVAAEPAAPGAAQAAEQFAQRQLVHQNQQE